MKHPDIKASKGLVYQAATQPLWYFVSSFVHRPSLIIFNTYEKNWEGLVNFVM